MVRMIIKLIVFYISGTIFAFATSICVWCLCFVPPILFDVCVLYVPTAFYLIMLLAMPLGASLGMLVVDKLIFKRGAQAIWRVVGAFLSSLLGIVLVWRILPLFGLKILDWVPLVHGVNIDFYLLPFVSGLFALCGYNAVDILSGCGSRGTTVRPSERNDVGDSQPTSPKGLERRTIVAILALCGISLAIFLAIVLRPTPWKAEEKARAFLEDVINSVNSGTDFYKKRSRQSAVSNIEEHKAMISNSYIIEVFNNEGPFEYFVTFDGKYTFKADVTKAQGGLLLHRFYFIPGRVGYRLDISD